MNHSDRRVCLSFRMVLVRKTECWGIAQEIGGDIGHQVITVTSGEIDQCVPRLAFFK